MIREDIIDLYSHALNNDLAYTQGERFTGAVTAMKTRAPILGGRHGDMVVSRVCPMNPNLDVCSHRALTSRSLLIVRTFASCYAAFAPSYCAASAPFPGNFAVWGGMFSAFDCSLAAVRKKEDAWNAITSGALTSGCLALRGRSVRLCSSRWLR